MHFALYIPLYDHLDYHENNIVWANCMAVSLKEESNRGDSEAYNFLIK